MAEKIYNIRKLVYIAYIIKKGKFTHIINTTDRQRTSDSLNEGLPIKMTREKFQRK